MGKELDSNVNDFDCLFHDTDPSSLYVLRRLVGQQAAHKPKLTIVEVGSWVGMSALEIAKAASTVPFQLHCIDHWEGNQDDHLGFVALKLGKDEVFRVFCRNIGSHLFRNVFPHRGTSALYASLWTLPLDLVFIDADHRYAFVKEDIAAWKKHVVPGGVLCGHDYSLHFPGVMKAVDEIKPDGVENSVWWKMIA